MSFKLIFEQLVQEKSQSELKNHLLEDPSFSIMKKSIKGKAEIIQMSLQTHI